MNIHQKPVLAEQDKTRHFYKIHEEYLDTLIPRGDDAHMEKQNAKRGKLVDELLQQHARDDEALFYKAAVFMQENLDPDALNYLRPSDKFKVYSGFFRLLSDALAVQEQ